MTPTRHIIHKRHQVCFRKSKLFGIVNSWQRPPGTASSFICFSQTPIKSCHHISNEASIGQHVCLNAGTQPPSLGGMYRGMSAMAREQGRDKGSPGIVGAPQYKKNIKLLDSVQDRSMKMLKGLELKPYKEQLKTLGLFSWRRAD